MNRYQDAFEKTSLCCLCTDTAEEAHEYLDILKELVDKAAPKKPHHFVHERYTRYYCPKCSKRLKKSWSACPICTTMIDWSDEE